MDKIIEANIDALPGPTHHFGGLSYGNIASTTSSASLSHPKKAALQSLEKMKLIASFGIPQFIFPPQVRPHMKALQNLGFQGKDEQIIHDAFIKAPHLLLMCSSSSSMWMANAACITPSCDSHDKKVHITAANLCHNFHRSLEVRHTEHLMRQLFSDPQVFFHHAPLPSSGDFFDEGAANHTRFCTETSKGVHLFVWGASNKQKQRPQKFPARQTEEASHAIARLHALSDTQTVFAKQYPESIDKGVFHNDVISTGFETLFLFHEKAFCEQEKVLNELQEKALSLFNKALLTFEVPERALSVEEAVSCYLFNSQIIKNKQDELVLLAPLECQENRHAKALLERLPISDLRFIDLKESMKNGGGPACLRLRVPLLENELARVSKTALFTDSLYQELKECILTSYPENFYLESLTDPKFLKQARKIVEKLHAILGFSVGDDA